MGVRSIGVAVAMVAAVAGPAVAQPQLAGEFEVRGTPGDIAVTADGAAWVTLSSLTRDVVRIDPAGPVNHHLSGASYGVPRAIATGADGRLWVAWAGGVGHFRPEDPAGTADRIQVTGLAAPRDLIAGPGGKLFTVSGPRIFIIDPAGERPAVVPPEGVVVPGMQDGRRLAATADGQILIADHAGHQLLAFDPISRTVRSSPLGGAPEALDVAPDGRAAVTVASGQVVIATPGGEPTVHPTGPASPRAALLGEDGNLWLPHLDGGRLVALAPDGGYREGPAVADGPPAGLAHLERGGDGTIWAALEYPGVEDHGRVARIVGAGAPPPPPPPPAAPEPVAEPAPEPAPPRPTVAERRVVDRTPPRLRLLGLTARVTPGAVNRLRVNVSERATLSAGVERRLPGRRVGSGPCRPATAATRRTGRACVRWQAVVTVSRTAGPGRVDLVIPGRVRSRPLAAGRYRVTVSARDAARNRAKVLRAHFEVAGMRR